MIAIAATFILYFVFSNIDAKPHSLDEKFKNILVNVVNLISQFVQVHFYTFFKLKSKCPFYCKVSPFFSNRLNMPLTSSSVKITK